MDKGSVAIVLDKERHLRLTLNALVDFQSATGKDLRDPQVIEALSANMGFADMRALLWACLRWEDRELTLDRVGDLVDLTNLQEVTARMVEAWTVALPKTEEKQSVPLA